MKIPRKLKNGICKAIAASIIEEPGTAARILLAGPLGRTGMPSRACEAIICQAMKNILLVSLTHDFDILDTNTEIALREAMLMDAPRKNIAKMRAEIEEFEKKSCEEQLEEIERVKKAIGLD